ncbi:2,5-diketo-D-gluconic acid reductase [Aerococcus urinaehominis]|uniref:2,5-diketo-D-gluconic acid reductase n=1 Tax=Aerococcus urinaehominis TaxID=128944 RepID=A0A109RG75_9LACT|nr:aldo/keto reductase [Aerococcus urinaehominis]AMB98680.1 2,5-diketo-D-gluconic acid reductase [Aerococcus urinaehominis]SDL98394.1 Aldo/keto reductase [Aerococcus urinaehominis]
MEYYQTYDGLQLPKIGLGTFKLKGQAGIEAITAAIDLGYRYIDTAYNYENEGTVGQAIRQAGVDRDDLIVASKLPGRYQRYNDTLTTIQESLLRAGLDYFDVYLIHWPNPKQGLYLEAWQAMIEAQKRGYIKELGTSNFLPEYIDHLVAETGVKPIVNQVERHPYFHQDQQIAYDQSQGIITQSWTPLGRANEKAEVSIFELPELQAIAAKHQKSIGQVVLRWQVQTGTMPIPKSSNPARLAENLAVFDFELDQDDLDLIKSYDSPVGRLSAQNPASYEEF